MMIQKIIRIHRKYSAFTYAILESLGGMVSYSTLNAPEQERNPAYRDLLLNISPGFSEEVDLIIQGLRKKFPVIEIRPPQH